MVGRRTWLVALPLLVATSEFGQWLLERVAPATHMNGSSFDHAEFGIGVLPLLLAVVFVASAVGLVLDVCEPATASLPRRLFALFPLFVFVIQEHIEYVVAHAGREWDASIHRSFLAGLLIQVPFAFAAYLAARILIRAAARVLRRRRRAEVGEDPTILLAFRPVDLALPRRARPLRDARFDRGPPLPAV
jgi:hypothetical protein